MLFSPGVYRNLLVVEKGDLQSGMGGGREREELLSFFAKTRIQVLDFQFPFSLFGFGWFSVSVLVVSVLAQSLSSRRKLTRLVWTLHMCHTREKITHGISETPAICMHSLHHSKGSASRDTCTGGTRNQGAMWSTPPIWEWENTLAGVECVGSSF